MNGGHLDRRRFIELSVAAAGSLSITACRRRDALLKVSWQSLEGFPDRPTYLRLSGPLAVERGEAVIEVWVETPEGPVSFEPVSIEHGGDADPPAVSLTYPFAVRINGDYRYHARVTIAETSVTTSEPASYTLRPLRLFA